MFTTSLSNYKFFCYWKKSSFADPSLLCPVLRTGCIRCWLKLSFHQHTCGLRNHGRTTEILMMLCHHLTHRKPWEIPRALGPLGHVYGNPLNAFTELFLPSSTPLPRVDHFSGDAWELPKWSKPPSNYFTQLMEDSLPLIYCQYSSLPLYPSRTFW